MKFSRSIALCLGALAIYSGMSHADSKECLSQSDTQLHRSYCEVMRLDPSTPLPSLADFKNNPPHIQALLLRRHAERFGIDLPKTEAASQRGTKTQTRVAARPRAAEKNTSARRSEDSRFSLKSCKIHEAEIRCGAELYLLETNKRNSQIQAAAFAAENQLDMPAKANTEFAGESDYRYLSFIYPKYIHKMLFLGLGDSTMSFTKFATVYWQAKLNKQDFVGRFKSMYSQLKIEKSQNGIQARYLDNYPVELHQCMRLDADIIVCDDMSQNWIYKRQ